jgi:hypothetical protein
MQTQAREFDRRQHLILQTSDSRCLIPFDRRESISIAAAAQRTGRVSRTLRRWCEEHCIGRRIAGGQWMVSVVALEMLLNDDAEALKVYLDGDRCSLVVSAYYDRAGLGALVRKWADQAG